MLQLSQPVSEENHSVRGQKGGHISYDSFITVIRSANGKIREFQVTKFSVLQGVSRGVSGVAYDATLKLDLLFAFFAEIDCSEI